jgi:predicted PurR-regulated permease PerM
MADGVQPGTANRWFIFGLLLVLGVLSFLVFKPFASYVVMGLLLAYAAHPVFTHLRDATGHPRVAALVVVVFIFLVFIGPLVYVTLALIQDVTTIARTLNPEQVRNMVELVVRRAYAIVGRPAPETGLATDILTRVVPALRGVLTDQVSNLFGIVTRMFVGLFLMGFVIYYALVDGERLLDYTRSVMPLTEVQSDHLLKRVQATVDAAFLGQIVVSIAQGAVGAVGFLIFGIPNPIFWGFLMIVLSVIPFVGAFLVWAPAGVILLATGDTVGGVGLLLWGFLPVSLVDNFLRPYLVGSRAEIHPALVLVGVLGGLLVFGFIGFVIGPLVLATFIAVLNFWRKDYLPMYMEQVEQAAPEGGGGEAGDG